MHWQYEYGIEARKKIKKGTTAMRLVALLARTRHPRALIGFVLFHLVFSSGVAFAFVQFFNHRKLAMIAHLWRHATLSRAAIRHW